MKKLILTCIIILILCCAISISLLVYKKYQSLDLPQDFKSKLTEAHKEILFFNYKRANKLYLAAIEQNPNNKLLEEYLAFLISQEDLKNSYQIATIILKYNPNHFLANLVNVAYLIKKNRLIIAIKNIETPAQDINSLNNAVFAILSTINHFFNKQDEEFKLLSDQIKKQLPEFYINQLALYYTLAKDEKNAIYTSKKAVEEYPCVDNIVLYSKLLFLTNKTQGIETFKKYLNNPFLTTTAIEHYLNNFPLNNIDLPYVVSDALFRISKYLSNNIRISYICPDNILVNHISTMLNPSNPLARIQIANYYIQLGDYNTALTSLNKINIGGFYYRLVYPEISKILVELGKTNKAIEVLSAVYNNDTTNSEPLLELGHLYYKSKKYNKAIKYYSEALKTAQNNNQPLGIWLSYYFRGIAYNQNDSWKYAEKDLLAALNINNKDALLLNYLGYSWIDKNININKGMQLIKSALEIEPNNYNFLDSYAWGLFKQGNYKEALRIALEVKKKVPLDTTLNNHIGDMYWVLNKKETAKTYWRIALNTNPDTKTKENLEEKLSGEIPKELRDASLYLRTN